MHACCAEVVLCSRTGSAALDGRGGRTHLLVVGPPDCDALADRRLLGDGDLMTLTICVRHVSSLFSSSNGLPTLKATLDVTP